MWLPPQGSRARRGASSAERLPYFSTLMMQIVSNKPGASAEDGRMTKEEKQADKVIK